MSEDIFDEKNSFFGNDDIPMATKLFVISLMLGGTYEVYTSPNGKKTYLSVVYSKGGDDNE